MTLVELRRPIEWPGQLHDGMTPVSLGSSYVEFMGEAFSATRSFLSPERDSYEHAKLELIKKVRTWGGIAITLAVALAYKTVGSSTVDNALYNIMFNGVWGIGAAAAGVCVYIVANRRQPRRLDAIHRTMTTIAAAALAVVLVQGLGRSIPGITSLLGALLVGLPLCLVMLLVVLPLAPWCAYWAFRNWFNVADTHPLLPAVCTAIYAAFLLVYNCVLVFAGSTDPRLPAGIAAVLVLGGPILVLYLAVWELYLAELAGLSLTDRGDRNTTK